MCGVHSDYISREDRASGEDGQCRIQSSRTDAARATAYMLGILHEGLSINTPNARWTTCPPRMLQQCINSSCLDKDIPTGLGNGMLLSWNTMLQHRQAEQYHEPWTEVVTAVTPRADVRSHR